MQGCGCVVFSGRCETDVRKFDRITVTEGARGVVTTGDFSISSRKDR